MLNDAVNFALLAMFGATFCLAYSQIAPEHYQAHLAKPLTEQWEEFQAQQSKN